MSKNKQQPSRFLSYVLRHKPDKIGITLDKNGWVDVDELLDKCKTAKVVLTREELETIVEENDKKRFGFNEDKTKIRASQGHTLNIDLGLKPTVPPTILYHGTVEAALKGIKKLGLGSMTRDHLHLSVDVATATNVGSRRGKAIILEIDAKAMYADGYIFTVSDNGVWLTNNVPFKYIKIT